MAEPVKPVIPAPLAASTVATIPEPAAPVLESPVAPQAKKTETIRPGHQKPAQTYGVRLGALSNLKDDARGKVVSAQQKEESLVICDENLREAWNALLQDLTRDKVIYRNALQGAALSFDQHHISIGVSGIALDFLKGHRIHMLEHFKKWYRNDAVNVRTVETAPPKNEGAEKVKSAREIFEEMAMRNPALRALKDKLGMDFEY